MCGLCGLRRRCRNVQRQHRVGLGVVEQQAHRRCELLIGGFALHVNGIARIAASGQQCLERGTRRSDRPRQRHADVGRAIGREQARAAAVGDDGQTIAARDAPRLQDHRGCEQLRVVVHAHGAGSPERGTEHAVGRKRAVARARLGGHCAARLEHNHGLGARRRAQRRQEGACIVQCLDVEHDAIGLRVGKGEVEYFAEIDVDSGAECSD